MCNETISTIEIFNFAMPRIIKMYPHNHEIIILTITMLKKANFGLVENQYETK